MPTGILISYRREDSLAAAARLRDRLVKAFGRNSVFIDIYDIPHGQDFVSTIENKLANCAVVLAIIASDWLEARNDKNERRLDDPNDFVRVEIKAALARDSVSVIPVLVDGGRMPVAGELPDDIKLLARRNAITLNNAQFDTDSAHIVRVIQRTLRANEDSWINRRTLSLAVAVLLLAAAGLYGWMQLEKWLSAERAQAANEAVSRLRAEFEQKTRQETAKRLEDERKLAESRKELGESRRRAEEILRKSEGEAQRKSDETRRQAEKRLAENNEARRRLEAEEAEATSCQSDLDSLAPLIKFKRWTASLVETEKLDVLVAAFLTRCEKRHVIIEDLTVGSVTSEASLKRLVELSKRRAQAVADFLVSKGVPRDRLGLATKASPLPEQSGDPSTRESRVQFMVVRKIPA
jgi:outer membrane protein OmpA-like peptidoglycan-associated protein